jgi:hypothetical protein
MKKILLLAIIGMTLLTTYSQNITYDEIISGAEDYSKIESYCYRKIM